MNLLDYPGGKTAIVRRLINLIPPHEVYIESHLGGGALLRHKRPARLNVGIDRDPAVIDAWRSAIVGRCERISLPGALAESDEDTDGGIAVCGAAAGRRIDDIAIDGERIHGGDPAGVIHTTDDRIRQPSLFAPMPDRDPCSSLAAAIDGSGDTSRNATRAGNPLGAAANGDAFEGVPPGLTIISGDGRRTVDRAPTVISDDAGHQFTFVEADAVAWLRRRRWTGNEFVYADPPYLLSTRSAGRAYYRCEYSDNDHNNLINILRCLPCPVMISGYWSELYADLLARWHTASFAARTHTYTATEYVWMNYPPPTRLHEYTYLGDGFRERERIKRKIGRWTAKLQGMDTLERQALLAALQAVEL